MAYTTYKEARASCQHWWGHYQRLPRWRWWARRKALSEALFWGSVATRSKEI